MPSARTHAEYELQEQRAKLANSYQSLLNDFSSHELHSVGNYTLGRLIGKGSFGKVYLASHKLINGSKVVLKSAKKDDANLAREIHHHRQFLHPHIARLYEVIVTESLVWLVLEYCPGDELYNHLLERGRMDSAKAQRVFAQLVGAVAYVHGKSCVHRDLKLENILLDKHGHVKLVDFGFTREYQGSTSYLQTWCGTVCYSAPEMLKGEKYAGEKVDVWSLGVILYALLCGELPFDEDDDALTKTRILKEEPKWPEHLPELAIDLLKRLLSKRPILRPSLADILKDPWLAENAPQQQEMLKLQQPAAFSTQVEKDTLERMRSAGVDIDMVIENVLSQRCDPLAGWWSLIIEKEQRKERRRERKRRERELEVKSIRRLSAASSRLLAQSALLEIQEGSEVSLHKTPSSRGRRMSRASNVAQAPDLPLVAESKTPTAELESPRRLHSRSRSRPSPPPKDGSRRPRHAARRSGSMLRYSTINPELISNDDMPSVPQRKRIKFYPPPFKDQIAWFKHLFKDGAKRAKYIDGKLSKQPPSNHKVTEKSSSGVSKNAPDLKRISSGPTPARPAVVEKPSTHNRAAMPTRPRLDTTASLNSITSVRAKRTSQSPGTLTPLSSYRHSSIGLRGRKSTSSSVSSIRTAYHQHTHSKTSSTSSASLVSPSGLSTASNSRLARSPHASVKMLPSTPTNTSLPSGIRISKKPLPILSTSSSSSTTFSNSGQKGLLGLADNFSAYSSVIPGSPSVPVFARRKKSVFRGPMGGSPAGFGRIPLVGGATSASASANRRGRSRSVSLVGRRSTEVIHGIEEEDEDAEDDDDDDGEMEGEVQGEIERRAEGEGEDDAGEQFSTREDPPMTPLHPPSHPLPDGSIGLFEGEISPKGTQAVKVDAGHEANGSAKMGNGVPLTAKALAQIDGH